MDDVEGYKKDALLEIRSVNKSYGSLQVLTDINLKLYRGEVLALLGVNGAGKTTLSSLIAAVHPVATGDIVYQGSSIYHDIIAYRSIIGYCPQKISDGSGMMTVYDQLWFTGQFFGITGHVLKDRIDDILKSFSLEEVSDRRLGELSGGYRQRFALARSVIHLPHIVILDEPTVALDPHVRRQLWNYIKQMKSQGVSIVLTTHYLDEAEYLADRICVLFHGKAFFTGTAQEWMAVSGTSRLEDAFLRMLSRGDDI